MLHSLTAIAVADVATFNRILKFSLFETMRRRVFRCPSLNSSSHLFVHCVCPKIECVNSFDNFFFIFCIFLCSFARRQHLKWNSNSLNHISISFGRSFALAEQRSASALCYALLFIYYYCYCSRCCGVCMRMPQTSSKLFFPSNDNGHAIQCLRIFCSRRVRSSDRTHMCVTHTSGWIVRVN